MVCLCKNITDNVLSAIIYCEYQRVPLFSVNDFLFQLLKKVRMLPGCVHAARPLTEGLVVDIVEKLLKCFLLGYVVNLMNLILRFNLKAKIPKQQQIVIFTCKVTSGSRNPSLRCIAKIVGL